MDRQALGVSIINYTIKYIFKQSYDQTVVGPGANCNLHEATSFLHSMGNSVKYCYLQRYSQLMIW